jgi:hypothetical protein
LFSLCHTTPLFYFTIYPVVMPKPRTKKMNGSSRVKLNQPGMPSQINVHPIHSRVFRFQNNAQVSNYVITRRSLLSLQGTVNVSATNALTIIQAIRIRRVSIWACAANGVQSVNVEWLDPHGPSIQKTASGTTTIPCHLVTRPPLNSFAALWSQVTATSTYQEQLFSVSLLEYSTIDVEVDLVYADGLVSANESISRTTTSTGLAIGYAPLDNSSTTGTAGTNQIVPVTDALIIYTS